MKVHALFPVAKLKIDDSINKTTTKSTSSYTISKHKYSPIVIIASSTGGPRALRTVVPHLTRDAGVSYVIIQHLPEGFSGPLAEDLNNCSELDVIEPEDGHMLMPGQALFAKAGYHLVFDATSRAKLTKAPPLWGVRPSADITMVSAVEVFGSRLISVVLTGMGRDGAEGTKLIKKAGGVTLAEDESTCVVYGMPRAAFETGCVDKVVPLNKMAEVVNDTIREVAMQKPRGSAA
ncbi:MAG: CheB methylesterase domain-containing protein [Armatimonadota bacterium]